MRRALRGCVLAALLAALLLARPAQAALPVGAAATHNGVVPAATGVAVPVPHFAGVPCADTGSCPWGPNCTVCGNYCGAGWCGSNCVPEGAACDFTTQPQALSCTDACCQVHDMCCGCYDGDTFTPECDKSGCNRVLAACLSACPWSDKCTGPDGTWGPKLIQLVFVLDQRRCCGSRCPGDPPEADELTSSSLPLPPLDAARAAVV